jgi:ABC-type bacteriocin/lantibiotic exporter with double-glycine peptidase domain
MVAASGPFCRRLLHHVTELNQRYVTSQLSAAAAASATAQEALAGIRTVKSFAKEQLIIDKWVLLG